MQTQLTEANSENVLTLLVFNDACAPAIVTRVKADTFGPQSHRIIAKAAIDYFDIYHRAPGPHIKDLLEPRLRGADGEDLIAVLKDMQKVNELLNIDYVMTQLDRFVALQNMIHATEKALEAADHGKLEEAQSHLQTAYVGHVADSPGIWLHKPEEALRFLDVVDTDFFPSGVPMLDEIGVRPGRKRQFLIVAPAKTGKTFWLIEMGKAAIHHSRKVLHITLEMSAEDTAQRYVQAIAALGRDAQQTIEIKVLDADEHGRFTKMETRHVTREGIKELSRLELTKRLSALRFRSRIYIKEFATGSLTMRQLEAFLDSLAKQEGFSPDLLIVDYADLMDIDPDNARIATGRLFRDLRGLAVRRNLALATATQGNRQSARAKVVRGDMVAEDWSKIATADFVVTINRTESEKAHNLARLLIDYSRYTQAGMQVLLAQSYATGQFCLSSVLMSSAAQAELKDMESDDGGKPYSNGELPPTRRPDTGYRQRPAD